MINDSTDSQILAQERFTIEMLSRATHTAITKVQEIFLVEYGELATHTHITAFLPLLASNRVRVTGQRVMFVGIASLRHDVFWFIS
jgi:hypothetical protein